MGVVEDLADKHIEELLQRAEGRCRYLVAADLSAAGGRLLSSSGCK